MFFICIVFFVKSSNQEETNETSYLNMRDKYYFVKERPFGQKTISSNSCGDQITYTIESNTLKITGQGEMYDFVSSPFYLDSEKINSIIIESGVTSIGSYAFFSLNELIDIKIPKTVHTIGRSCFGFCSKLKTITTLHYVTKISPSAFNLCKELDNIDISELNIIEESNCRANI